MGPDEPLEGAGSRSRRWVGPTLTVAVVVALGALAGPSLLVIVAVLAAMLFVHELGHYAAARSAGMKVTELFVGRGPRVWSFRRGETTYGLKAIPAGAYVRILGMTDLEEVDPADEPRTYRQQPYWRRMSVVLAGPATHLVLAFACIYAVLVTHGGPNGRLGVDPADWAVGVVSEGSAAEVLGIEPGDTVVSVDGVRISTFEDVVGVVRPRGGETASIVWVHDGVERSGSVRLGIRSATSGAAGGFLGVGATFDHVPVTTAGPLAAVPRAAAEVGGVMRATVGAFGDLVSPDGVVRLVAQVRDGGSDAPAAVGGPPAGDDDRPISILGVTLLGRDVLETDGIAPTLLFLAAVNVFIGVFNLVPLLPFDGGHAAIATYERVRELLRRDGRRHVADVARLVPLTLVVVVALVGLGMTTLYLDIVDPVQIGT